MRSNGSTHQRRQTSAGKAARQIHVDVVFFQRQEATRDLSLRIFKDFSIGQNAFVRKNLDERFARRHWEAGQRQA